MTRAIVKKNGRERIEVSISDFKNRKFLDIRNYFNDGEGEWKPTPKGISIPVELAHAVYRAVKKVGAPFFDLLPPPGKEQEADDAINEKLAKSATAESGIKRRKKTVTGPVHDDDDEAESQVTRIKKVKKGTKKSLSKTAKKIGKKVADEYLAEIDAKIAKKKKKKAVTASEPTHKVHKRPNADPIEVKVKKKRPK